MLLVLPAIARHRKRHKLNHVWRRTVDLRADRAWVFVPGQCVTVSWNLEGIQSLYIDGGGKIGWGEEKFCPSLEATSPTFEITAANGETRSFSLGIHYLPADVIHNQSAVWLLLLPFLIAIILSGYTRAWNRRQ